MKLLPPPRRRRPDRRFLGAAALGIVVGVLAGLVLLGICSDPPPLPARVTPTVTIVTPAVTATPTPSVLAVTPIAVVTVTPVPTATPAMAPGHLGSGGLLH